MSKTLSASLFVVFLLSLPTAAQAQFCNRGPWQRVRRPAWVVNPPRLRSEIPPSLGFDEIPDDGEVGTPPRPETLPPAIVLPRRDGPPAIVLPRRDGAPAIVLPPRYVPQAPLRTLPPAYRPQPRAPAAAAPRVQPVAPSKPSVNAVELTQAEAQALRLLNQERKRRGLSTLRVDPKATIAARAHSADMCNRRYFNHRSPEGSAPWDRLRQAGARFTAAAENIAVGYTSAQGVHDGWMRSAGHRANRLNGRYGRVGIGVYRCEGRPTWTELFMN